MAPVLKCAFCALRVQVQWPVFQSEISTAIDALNERLDCYKKLQESALAAEARGEKWVPPPEETEEKAAKVSR